MTTREPAAHLSEDELVLLHYGEHDEVDCAVAHAHLERCGLCRDERERLALVLAMVSDHTGVEAPEGFERVMWARIQPVVEPPARGGWRAWFSPARLALVGAAAALVIGAFVAGRWSGVPAPAPAGSDVASVVPERVLLVAVGEHLEHSQMVLVELLNADPVTAMSDGERQRAAELVSANRLIRHSASMAGEAAVADVLDDLERVLIEIANGPPGESAAELQLLRTRIESRGILFRMRVVSSSVRERGRGNGPPVS